MASVTFRAINFKTARISEGEKKKPQGHRKIFTCLGCKGSFRQNRQHINLLWEPNTFAGLRRKGWGTVILNGDDSHLSHPLNVSLNLYQSHEKGPSPRCDDKGGNTVYRLPKVILTADQEQSKKHGHIYR